MCHLLNLINKKVIVILILLATICTNVYASYSPTSSFYVNDFANLLSANIEQYIINVNTSLESQTGAQVVVTTVPNLQGKNLEEYATDMFRSYGIGNGAKNNGVLLLLAYEERQFRIEVGYGLEGRLNDGKTGAIQDLYIIPYLKEGKWDEGIKNGFDAIIQEVCKEYEITVSSDKPIELHNTATEFSEFEEHSWLAALGIILGSVFGLCSKLKRLEGKKAFGYTLLGCAMSAGIAWLIVKNIVVVIGMAIINLLGAIFMFIIISSNVRIGISGGYYNGRHSSSGSRSSSGRHYSGGGGRSGGGGSSRGF